MSATARSKWALAVLVLAVWGCPGSGTHGDSKSPPPQKPAELATTSAAAQVAPLQTARPAVVLLPPGRDPVTVRIRVARNEDERRRGLMFEKRLDEDAGMLFLFEQPQQLTFWMRNTYIPLDMIFIERSMRILGVVENAEPLTDSSRSVPGESQYVLEVNAGFSRHYGLTHGTAVRFEGVTPLAKPGNDGK
jgi:uncharacterized membrane protein (UPF0127 family)